MEVDQTLASKPGTSQAAVNLDLPPPRQPRTTSNAEQMEVDYGPTLPPHLSANHHMASDQLSSPAEEPSKKASVRPKKHSHSHRKHDVDPRPASINTMMSPMNLGFHLLNPKSMLTRVSIRSGPDTHHLPQRRISPL